MGLGVISRAPAFLHLPLMSGSNAISGITLIGAIIVLRLPNAGWFTMLLGLLAVAFATINVVGGFLVTHRMLEMFKRRD